MYKSKRARSKQYDNQLKLTIVGDSTVGKSSIVQRLAFKRFTSSVSSTIGGAFCTFKYNASNNQSFRFQVWDTAGQERYQALIPMYLKGSKIVLIVFDITNVDSFQAVKNHWLEFANESAVDAEKILIGSKLDLVKDRQVSERDAENFAAINGLEYIECSSKTSNGIPKLLDRLGTKAMVVSQSDNDGNFDNEIITLERNENGDWKDIAISTCSGEKCSLL